MLSIRMVAQAFWKSLRDKPVRLSYIDNHEQLSRHVCLLVL